MAEITGLIEEIVFRNEDNGFSVVEIRDEDTNSIVTAVGSFPFLSIGERVRLTGEWVRHPEYGRQLKMETYVTVAPSTLTGMENYLASGLIKGVGPSTARKLIEHFGLDVLDVIQFSPSRLTEVEGIGETRAALIASSFAEQREIREVMLFLQAYRISTAMAFKIYKSYGSDTIGLIKQNPYRLAEDIEGIGFRTADAIAARLGIDPNSMDRAAAGIRYVLAQAASDGHTYLPKAELVDKAARLLLVDKALVENALVQLAVNQAVVMEDPGDGVLVYLAPLYRAEANTARLLSSLAAAGTSVRFGDIDKEIREFERRHHIELADRQKEAVIQVMENGIVVITGGPGTGKTTTINCIISLLVQKGLKFELAAPTGRAAKRMTEATGYEAKTIHRLLEYVYSEGDGGSFQKNEENPIKADAIIIDEMSMVDILLMHNLLKATIPGTRLVLAGDVDQLPSVGPGNVLKDIINSGTVTVVKLTEIFRQARESMIVVNAHRINRGELPLLNVKDKDFFFDRRENAEDLPEVLKDLVVRRLPGYNNYDPATDIQVLVPMRKGVAGVHNLNLELQSALNPPSPDKNEKRVGETIFRQYDKVMQIKNNYSLKWSRVKDGEVLYEGEGVFNGDMGIIQQIDHEVQTLSVLFDDDRLAVYDFSQLDELEPAYAITIHKSQGSEFPVVIIPLVYGPPMLMTRNLLYTAVTRAKELVVIVGREEIISRMVNNNHIEKRYSLLDKRLKAYCIRF